MKTRVRISKYYKILMERGYTLEGIEALRSAGYKTTDLISYNIPANMLPVDIDKMMTVPANNQVSVTIPVQDPELSDEDILTKQIEFFKYLNETAFGVACGDAKSLIVTGSAGIGKSFGIEQAIGNDDNVCYVNGHVTASGLYSTLYNYRFNDNTIIFDDSDRILYDETSLGILKNALDMKKTRSISWLSKAVLKDEMGETIPQRFNFQGSIIFISNINLSAQVSRDTKLSPHIEAIISRSLYIDGYAIFKTTNDYMIRINYLKEIIFESANISQSGRELISAFIDDNADRFRELSLRLVSKLCAIYKIHGTDNFDAAAKMLTMK